MTSRGTFQDRVLIRSLLMVEFARKLVIKNNDKRGVFTLEGRLSRGYCRYESLPALSQFPIALDFGQSIEIEVGTAREFLYYRTFPKSLRNDGNLYRVALPDSQSEFLCEIVGP